MVRNEKRNQYFLIEIISILFLCLLIDSFSAYASEQVSTEETNISDDDSSLLEFNTEDVNNRKGDYSALTDIYGISVFSSDFKYIETIYNKQEELSDFISKLPYTRLGSGPYAKAYEFIIEPTEFENRSTAVTVGVQEAGAVAGEADSQFLINLLIILLILIIGGFVVKRYLVGKVERKEPVYGNE